MPLEGLAFAGLKGLEYGFQSGQNKRNIEFQKEQNYQDKMYAWRMYQQQRFDKLMDWSLENRYNSPKQQMQRLKEAGLNPNLIYGNGAVATGGNIQSPSAQSPTGTAPHSDFNPQFVQSLAQYQDYGIKQVTTDNLRKQGELLEAETANKNIDTATKAVDKARSEFEYNKAIALKDLIIEDQTQRINLTKEQIANAKYERSYKGRTLDQKDVELAIRKFEYQLKRAKNEADIRKIHEDILRSIIYRTTNEDVARKLQLEADNLIKEGKLKDVDLQLRSQGLEPFSPEWIKRYTSIVTDLLKF